MSRIATFTTTTTAFGPLDTTTALRPARLVCPECSRYAPVTEALKSFSVGKMDFHHCPDCGGAWFQDKGVDEALRAAGERPWPGPTTVKGVVPAEAEWLCPCCQGRLVAINDRRGSGAQVRRCLVCYGGWIEHADLLKACETSTDMLSKVGRFVRHLLR
jgi:Zn-finger nucleic acid-binding protein